MFIFLSYKIDLNTPVYGGRKGFLSAAASSIKNGDTANTSKWKLPNHLGTHIDFPYHFYINGQTLEDFSEDFWVFDGKSIQILEVDMPKDKYLIEPKNIKEHDINFDAEFLILKTGIGKYRDIKRYWKYNPGINIETVEWIREKFEKLKIIGIDSISISSWQHRDIGREAHKIFLDPKKPVLIIEDMNLSKITSDTVFKMIYIAPLLVKGADGSPCTVFAEVQTK